MRDWKVDKNKEAKWALQNVSAALCKIAAQVSMWELKRFLFFFFVCT